MKTLIELIHSSRPNKCLLRGKTLKLVEGILSKGICSKQDAAEQLFKNSADPIQSVTKLIQRAKKVMVLSVLSSPIAKSPLHKAHNDANSSFATALIMLGGGNRHAGLEHLRRAYKIAIEYELLHIASAAAMKLTKHYAESNPQPKLQKRFAKEAQKYAKLIVFSTQSNNYYAEAINMLNNRFSYSKGLIEKLESFTAEMAEITHTTEITTQYFTLEVIKCFAYQNYAAAAMNCTTVLNSLKGRVEASNTQRAQFLSLRSIAAIADKNYRVAEHSLLEAIDLTGHSPMNYQILMFYRAVCALHEGEYLRAEHIYKQITARKQFAFMRECWAIIHAYLNILNGRSFRLGKFFNETIEASQDKAGLNIHILIADLLISLRQNRDRFLHRLEAVRNYSYRHLKGKATERVRFFLDLLFLIPKCDFDRERLEKASRLIQVKLKRRSIYANHNLEIEVVPFEVLVRVVMAEMGEGRRRRVG